MTGRWQPCSDGVTIGSERQGGVACVAQASPSGRRAGLWQPRPTWCTSSVASSGRRARTAAQSRARDGGSRGGRGSRAGARRACTAPSGGGKTGAQQVRQPRSLACAVCNVINMCMPHSRPALPPGTPRFVSGIRTHPRAHQSYCSRSSFSSSFSSSFTHTNTTYKITLMAIGQRSSPRAPAATWP